MKLFAFAVRDTAAVAYGTPVFVPSVGQAIRSFSDEVNRSEKDNVLFAHSSDFELHQLGEFDTDTGVFVSEVKMLVRGMDVRVRGEVS